MAILATSLTCGQTPAPTVIESTTPSNIFMQGLYRSNSSASPLPRIPENAVQDAFRAFSNDQNEDGSWGTPSSQLLATPLVFMAYLGSAETEKSEKYGSTVSRARKWILGASPTSHEERIATILALTEYVLLTKLPDDTATIDHERIRKLLGAVSPRENDPWTDLISRHRLPPSIPRPSWAQPTKELKAKWETAELNLAPASPLDYLELRLAGLARFQRGGKSWTDFNNQAMPALIARQANGYFQSGSEDDKYACTAFAIQNMQVFYAFQPPFWQGIPATQDKDEEIIIDIK